jgi:PAS domain S-box-containing protein
MPSDPGQPAPRNLRVLLLPPTSRDADAIQKLLSREGFECEVCKSLPHVCEWIGKGVGAIFVSEESLYSGHEQLAECVTAQPVWSDLPIIVLSKSGAELPALAAIIATLGNVTVLERPVRMTTMASMVRAALRARERQYQVRDQLEAREKAEAALLESRKQLELVVKGAQVGMWDCPLPFDRLIWDETVKAHFHMPPDAEVTIDDFYARLHDCDRERVRETIAESIASRQPYDIDYRTVSPDGEVVKWIRAMGTAIYDGAGSPTQFSGITIDATERVRVKEELQASAERLKLAVHTGRLGVWELDLATNELTCSATYKANFGRPTDAPFTYDELWKAVHPDDAERVRAVVAASIADRTEYEIEYRNIWPDGTVHWVLARGRTNLGPDGTPNQLIGVTLDITERRSMEEQRAILLEAERAARGEAERAGQMKDEFLATLSHELRTPLNAVLGWAQLLQMPSVDAKEMAEGVTIIERNARAQAQIIEDLLDMSRIISGKVRLEVQSLDLASVVQAALETVQPAAYAKEIRVRALLDSEAGPITGDPNRLQQVFWNLLSNAVKFTPKGGRVQVELKRVDSHLEVSVTDNGEGIEPAFLPHVFDRFRQADATTSRAHGGLGLGLAIVRQLVELHGGTISVRSAGRNSGSSFVVALPMMVVHASREPKIERRHTTATASPTMVHQPTRMAGIKVVIVDDEPDARSLLRRLLEDCDAEVHTAETAEEAINLVQAQRPHVLISDIGMPGEDGYGLIRRVRALSAETGGHTPAVALTAYARAEDRVTAIVAGFQHHLSKPVEPNELIAIVASLAGRPAPV